MSDPVNEYCSFADVESRLTTGGYLYVADRDFGGTGSGVSETERDKYILSGIEYAGGLIDVAIDPQYSISQARGSGNKWLRDRAIDIACYRAATNGGEEISEAMTKDYVDAQELLEKIRTGQMRVPGLKFETPRGGRSSDVGVPSVTNPKRVRRRRGRGCC